MAKQRTTTRKPMKKGRFKIGPGCRMHPDPIAGLGDFFSICGGVLREDTEYWFRGHADFRWTLTPSALRYDTATERDRALGLLHDFKRYAETKLPHLPEPKEELKWVQLARHYGLPTRLLDGTRNAAIALYFACERRADGTDTDGAVYMLNPEDLNRMAYPKDPRIYDAHSDAKRIARYLALSGSEDEDGLRTIAMNPVWNDERIVLQQGVFTLHGSVEFTLTADQAPSLVCFCVPTGHKQRILRELERAGTNEMSIYPEPEHMCRYLVWRERLDILGAHNG
jgi:hypothetical protein